MPRTSKFTFKEIDPEGAATLEAISSSPRFNEWMYETISPYLSGQILEIGSGIGNISKYFIKDKKDITLSDLRENYIKYLKVEFANEESLKSIRNVDLVHPDFQNKYAELIGRFDAVFALNVVEHIENDELAIGNANLLLKPGGTLLILVPAFQSLYNTFDRALEHYRRYTKFSLGSIFKSQGLEITNQKYFNLAAIAGWFFSGNILRKKIIPKGQMKLYDKLVPIFKVMDRLILNRVGISVIVVGKKTVLNSTPSSKD